MTSLRVHGKGSNKYENVRIGLNARLDTIQAAILLEKLAIFPDELAKRQAIASAYSDQLREVCLVPELPNWATSAWAQYTIVIENRDGVSTHLKENGIPSVVYYPTPLNTQKGYSRFPTAKSGSPEAEYLSQHVLSLPMHPYLENEDINRICSVIRSFK